MDPIEINIEETFPYLSRAPITEAVLEFRGDAGIEWGEEGVSQRFAEVFADYPNHSPRNEFQSSVEVKEGQVTSQNVEHLGWVGIEARDKEDTRVVRLMKNSFGFSHLSPYPGWESFLEDAWKGWERYQAIAECERITRIGLRVINRIDLPDEGDLDAVLRVAPREPQGLPLPFTGFMHRDHLMVPGYPYAIQCTRALKPPEPPAFPKTGLLIDVDVSIKESLPVDKDVLTMHLTKMRWLKNKVFFGTLQPEAIDKLT